MYNRVSDRQASQSTRSLKTVSKEAATTSDRPDSQTASVRDRQQTSPNQIWAKFSSGEKGVYESMAKGNVAMQRLSDQAVAKDALLAGHAPIDIQKAIAQNSSHAQKLEYPRAYARNIVKKAEASPEVKEKRAKDEKQSTALQTRPSRKEAQRSQVNSPVKTKNKSRQKTKGRDRGMSY